jgi:8-oxo-dGTP pyrophosphatase MutT (NUDIX family)
MRDVQDVPPPLRERARDYLDAGAAATVAPTRDAATVVLLRDRAITDSHEPATGPDVYLLRRAPSMAFAAGMHVFPGGSVDPRDSEVGHLVPGHGWGGPPPAQWARALTCAEGLARALVLAAVRETFEESGVLLAGPDEASVVAETTGPDLEGDRLALLDRTASMAEVLERRGLVLRSDLLRPWAHWVTPEFEPRRFDTRFFVAAVPPGQLPRDVSGEADSTVWLAVRDAVARHDRGELDMLPPTIVALRELAAFDTVAEVLAVQREVRRVMPRLVDDAGTLRLLIGDDA